MLARTARQAARAAQRSSKQGLKAPSLARSYATPAQASGPHERASGFNSAAAGAGVFGATILLGYVMGVLGDHSKREEALRKLDSAAAGSNTSSSAASKGSKAVKVVSSKADEAAESMPTKPATKSSKASKASKSSPSSISGPSVSSTGASTPLLSVDEPQSPPPSPTSSISDPGSLSETEESMTPPEGEEDASQAAFDPETGEINWDCPCLGGMAHGVCGEQFKEAFSCFVYSEEEPKGQDCIDKFRAMQDCFRAHPEVYGEEVRGPDDEDEQEYDVVTAVEAALAEEAQKQ